MGNTGKLSKRMRGYESCFRFNLIKRMPVIIRVDGETFHSYTQGCTPFSEIISNAFDYAICQTIQNMQGFKVAYTQSDEVSFLLTDFDTINTTPWFDNKYHKLVANPASKMTGYFNEFIQTVHNIYSYPFPHDLEVLMDRRPATFSCLAFNMPKDEVSNYFLERALDNRRNSISKFARMFFSDKQLHGQGQADIHEMLHKINKNWTTDLPEKFRNGMFYMIEKGQSNPTRHDNILPKYKDISSLIEPFMVAG